MINKIYIYLFSTLLLLSINLPTVYKEVKIVVLVLLLLVVGYKFIINRLYLKKEIAFLSLFSLLISLLFFMNGLLNENIGAVPSMTVFIIWPLVYILLISINNKDDIFRSFDRVMLFSSYFIPIYGVYFLLGKAGAISDMFFINIFPEDAYIGIGLREGAVEVSLLNFSSLLFLTPYIFVKFLLMNNIKDKIVYGIAIFLLISIVFLSGRRALLVVELFSFFLIYTSIFFIANKKVRLLIKKKLYLLVVYGVLASVLLFLIVLNYYDVDFYQFYENLVNGFSFGNSDDESTQIRTQQFFALIEGWYGAPLFGNGLGAVASMIRNDTQPWAYELTYVALLFQVGILGVIFYNLLVFWIVWEALKLLKYSRVIKYIFPYTIGMISFLIGNASNPYLFKFDYIWVIFLPIMFINYYKIQIKRGVLKHENI